VHLKMLKKTPRTRAAEAAELNKAVGLPALDLLAATTTVDLWDLDLGIY